MALNLIYIVILSAGVIGAIALLVRGGGGVPETVSSQSETEKAIEALRKNIKDRLALDPTTLNLNRRETEKQTRLQEVLRNAKNTCCHGDAGKRSYMKDFIHHFLQSEYRMTTSQRDGVIPFDDVESMTGQDKFEILLYVYSEKRGHGAKAFQEIINQIGRKEIMKENQITEEQVDRLFRKAEELEESEKWDVLTQRIYELLLGLGVVDPFRHMNLNGISAGVSGIPDAWRQAGEDAEEGEMSYSAVWVSVDGSPIRLSFLSFGSQKELIRVVKKIYRYDNPEELSAKKGFVTNFTEDMCRISVARPPYSSSWSFILRMHMKGICDLKILLREPGHAVMVDLLELLVKAGMSMSVSGNANTGKTTVLRALLGFVPEDQPVRLYEEVMEIRPQIYYKFQNIMNFQSTQEISGGESFAFQKKTDGTVNVLGELASEADAAWAIQTGQNNSRQALFTVHTMSAKALVDYMRNALCRTGVVTSTEIAEKQVVSVLRFDIHTALKNNRRYIERITEIVPADGEESYRISDIVVNSGDGTGYHVINRISEETEKQIMRELPEEEWERFQHVFLDNHKGMAEDCI